VLARNPKGLAMSFDPDLNKLVTDADHVQLVRLVTEIGWRIDNGRAETVHELFTDEGQLSMGPDPVSGREALREWGRALDETRPLPGIRHVATNSRFLADGPDRAHGTTTLTAYLVEQQGSGETIPYTVGEDQDTFARTAEGWRFSSRLWVPWFNR
jgi:hypothetical protein